MMIGSATGRWLLTVVFVAGALGSGLGLGRLGSLRHRTCAPAFCVLMCAALIVMIWWSEPAGWTWMQVAGFGAAGLWLVLASGVRAGRLGAPTVTGAHHGLMAGAMIWMLVALQSAAGGLALVVTGLVAAYCVVACVPWLARAIGPGPRVTNPAAAGQAVMCAGMATMLIAMM